MSLIIGKTFYFIEKKKIILLKQLHKPIKSLLAQYLFNNHQVFVITIMQKMG